MKIKIITILAAIVLVLGAFPQTAEAVPETKPSIAEETFIPIENHSFDDKGYLNMRALTPIGFAGAVCVDLKNLDTGEVQTEKLEYMESYIGGIWLPEGSYEVVDPRPETGDFFLVESSASVVEISHTEKAGIELVVRPDPETMARFEQAHADYQAQHNDASTAAEMVPTTTPATVPTVETSPAAPTELRVSTAPITETEAETQAPSSEDIKESGSAAARLIPTLAALAVFVGVAALSVWVIRKKYE